MLLIKNRPLLGGIYGPPVRQPPGGGSRPVAGLASASSQVQYRGGDPRPILGDFFGSRVNLRDALPWILVTKNGFDDEELVGSVVDGVPRPPLLSRHPGSTRLPFAPAGPRVELAGEEVGDDGPRRWR